MVEVFRTNVEAREHADMLIHHIRAAANQYCVNFDLDDCDRILRIQCDTGMVKADVIIELLKDFGFSAEVLPDSTPSDEKITRVIRRYHQMNVYPAFHRQ
jgi:hypothetical protein